MYAAPIEISIPTTVTDPTDPEIVLIASVREQL
jgi:hypothetical protein